MSTPEESLNDQDPDYVSATSNDRDQQKIYEENARNTTAKKITAIVEREFSQEIDLKEKEVLQVQERLHKTLKICHLLRYVIVSNFYNRKQCQAAETTKQTRIHPAIKTLLGKCPKSTDYVDLAVPSTSTDPRFLCDNESLSSGANSAADDVLKVEENASRRDDALQGAKRKAPDEEPQPRKMPRYVPPKSSAPEKTSPSRGNSHQVRKRIIVGNISKWIPPDWREDAASHKWTVYVRGDQENANISSFVTKVRFFLHPSYRPNDVVEITSYPFHLSRRGWGEFPLRVQVHFKNALNKPLDIIHHLKLDRTYTGLQTLGSETLADVFIRTAEFRNPEQNNSDDTFVKREPNDGRNSEFFHGADASRFSIGTSKEIQKEETSDSEERERFNSSLDLLKNLGSVGIKTESNGTATRIPNDKEAINYSIEHDHNYCSSQYLNSRYIVREGNVTVKHFPDNDCTTSTIDSPVESNKKKSDVTTTSNRFNGDIQSSSNHQPLVPSNATTNDSLVASINPTFQENDSQNCLLSSNTDKSLRAKNSKSNDSLKSLEITSTKRTMTINGVRKSSASLDRFDNLQKTASPSEVCNSHLKPLEISIPPSNVFASPTNKHVLLLKDKKSIPVGFTNILPSNGNSRLNVRVPQAVSILKKQPNKANAQQEDTANNNRKTAVLKLKSTNSLLLNVNENVPILKIADTRNSRYNYSSLAEIVRGVPGKHELACARKPEKTTVRSKITLGKDKFKIQSKKGLYEAVLRAIETAKIAEQEALIRFIIRRLPIVTQDARDPEYRRLHPYACSEEEYLTYNDGKQRAMEWYRAKMIKDFLQTKPIPTDRLWSVKEIIQWARLHGYTPSRSACGVQETVGTSDTKKLPDTTMSPAALSTYTELAGLQKWLETCQRDSNHQSADNYVDDEEIDIESIEDPRKFAIDRRKNDGDQNSTGSTLIPIELDEKLLPFHNFVCNTARGIGVTIGPEEVVPGVLHCAASRVMMRVVECFVEDLTRSSLAKAWERGSGNECPEITLSDVRNALTSREEFDILTNEGLGSKQELNTAEL